MTQSLKEQLNNGTVDRLKSEATGLIGAFGDRAISSVREKVEGATGRLTDYTDGGGGPGLMAAVTGVKGLAEGKSPVRAMAGAGMTAVKEKVKGMFGKGGGSGKVKVTNIVESIDVGVPVSVAYNQWTQFSDFPSFMKKVENVEQEEDEKLNWKAQVFWSHRTWESTILEQNPDDKIIWRSSGAKGYVDGAVTFHELAPNLTRILVVLEYHPQGLFEHTGNIWRAQGRRARLELKHFRRHVMSDTLLHPDEVEGWRGMIHEGEVVDDGSSGNGKARSQRRGRGNGQRGEESKSRAGRSSQASGPRARRSSADDGGPGNGKRARSSTRSSSGASNGGRTSAQRTRQAAGSGGRSASGRASASSSSGSGAQSSRRATAGRRGSE